MTSASSQGNNKEQQTHTSLVICHDWCVGSKATLRAFDSNKRLLSSSAALAVRCQAANLHKNQLRLPNV